MQPFFSIMVPVYNMEKYIDECILSVLNQTYQDYELLLIDDGSTDHSGEICDHYEREYQNIKVFHKTNTGLLQTRRYGIQRANGKYYVFLDADDYLQPDALETIINTIWSTDCDCVVYGYCRVYDGNFVEVSNQYFPPKTICDKAELYKTVFFDSRFNCLSRKAIKANIVDGNNYADEGKVVFAEDLLQSIEIYKNSQKITFIPNLLYNYRVNKDSITQSVSCEGYDYRMRAREKVLSFLTDENVFSDEEMDQYSFFCWKIICSKITEICGLKADRNSRIALLNAMRSQPYTQTIIDYVGACGCKNSGSRIIWELYRNRHYSTILALVSLRKIVSSR